MKLNLILCFLLTHLTCGVAFAQTAATPCVYSWCDAKWPPAEGQDRTVGKDNCESVCIKIARPVEKIVEVPALPCVSAPGLATWRVEFAKADYIYHTDIEADVVETVGTFLVFRKEGVEVARFSAKYVLWYILVKP